MLFIIFTLITLCILMYSIGDFIGFTMFIVALIFALYVVVKFINRE